jgi:hypothetical protein
MSSMRDWTECTKDKPSVRSNSPPADRPSIGPTSGERDWSDFSIVLSVVVTSSRPTDIVFKGVLNS